MSRACTNGHTVSEDYLKACPRCGAQLPPAPVTGSPSLAATAADTATEGGSRAPRALATLGSGMVLGLFGWLLSYAAGRGPAEVMGELMLGLGGVLVLVGAVALGVKIGIEDARSNE